MSLKKRVKFVIRNSVELGCLAFLVTVSLSVLVMALDLPTEIRGIVCGMFFAILVLLVLIYLYGWANKPDEV